ncbi:unnamed protein product [Allacma fusca]|uniref:EF-hand domain-containing protein n=1 Tax=Allacma fusca TaxID=39272 RepID=A0A8J2PC71_9HEXA|nr:unnamed protein product [Allacma fusca]
MKVVFLTLALLSFIVIAKSRPSGESVESSENVESVLADDTGALQDLIKRHISDDSDSDELTEHGIEKRQYGDGNSLSIKSFTDNHHIPPNDCTFLPLSSSPFIFGKIDQNVLSITRDTLESKKRLILICEATYPVRWLAQKPLGAVTYLSTDETNRFDQNPLTKEPLVFTQGIVILLGDEFSRKLRCESLSNSNQAADAFLNSQKFSAPVWTIPNQLTANFVVDENKEGFTVPCVAEEFHGNFALRFIKRARVDLILDARPSKECEICTLTSSSNPLLSALNDNFQCKKSGKKKSVDGFTGGLEAASDCNGDGIISCREFSWAVISGGCSCSASVSYDVSLLQDILTQLQNCLIQPTIRSYRQGPDNYDPRIGFRLTEKPDFKAAYECRWQNRTKDVKYPLNSKLQKPASLLYVKGKIFCNVDSNQYELNLMIGSCSSVTECGLKFELMPPLFLSAQYPYPESEYETFEINGDHPNWIEADRKQGYVQCHGSYSEVDADEVSFVSAVDYLFTGLDGQKYFTLQGFPIWSVIVLSTDIQQLNSNGLNHFTCKISTFVLLPNIQFVIEYGNDVRRREIVKPENRSTLVKSEFNPMEATLVHQLELKLSGDISKILCFAPWRNSTEWAFAERVLNSKE